MVLLRRAGWKVSTSMVGRILTRLKARGALRAASGPGIAIRRRRRQRPSYAARKPRGYRAIAPGDSVQIGTLDVRSLPGVILKRFTARDVVSRWDALSVHSRATAAIATKFLHTMKERLTFPIRAVQVDGGGEFQAGFEAACQQQGIRLFVLPLRSIRSNQSLDGCAPTEYLAAHHP